MITIDNVPALKFTNPANGSQNIPIDTWILGSANSTFIAGSIILSNQQGDTRRIAIHDSSQVQFTDNLLIKPRERLLHNSKYYVQFDTGSIMNLADNNNINPVILQFITSADTTPPNSFSRALA